MPNIRQQKKHEMVDSDDERNEYGSTKAEPSPLTDQSATSMMTHNSSNAAEGGHIISSNGGAQICGGNGTVPMPLISCWSPCSASSAGDPLLWYETDKCQYCNQKCRKPRRLLDCLHYVCEECVPEQCLLLDNLEPDEIRCPNCSQVAMSSISGQSTTESSRVENCVKHNEKFTRFCLSCDRLVCMKCVESDEHREHNSLPLDDELKRVCRQRLEQLGQKAEQKAKLLEHAKVTIPTRKQMLHLSYNKCCEKIENSFANYGHVLVQVKAQLLSELVNNREAAEQDLDTLYEKIGLQMPTFKRAIRSAHLLLERGDAAELYLGRSDVRLQLKLFAQTLPETNEKVELHFVPPTNATFKKNLKLIVGTIGSRPTALHEGEEPNMLANEQQQSLPTAQVGTVTEVVADVEHSPASTQIQHQATAESFLRCKQKLHLSYNKCREKIENSFVYYGHVLVQVKAQLLSELVNNREAAEQYLHNLYDQIDDQLASFDRQFRRQKTMVENYDLMDLCLDKSGVRMMLKLIIDALPEANHKIEQHFNAPTKAEFKKRLECIVGTIESRSMLLLEDVEPSLLGNKQQLSLSAPQVNTVTDVAGREKHSFNLSGTSTAIHHQQLGKRSHPASTSEDAAPLAKRIRANEVVSTPTEFSERIDALKARGVHTWTVEEVSGWANLVTGSDKIGECFVEEEVDGDSLLCLQFEQLKTDLKLKLGPLAKIWKSLEELKRK